MCPICLKPTACACSNCKDRVLHEGVLREIWYKKNEKEYIKCPHCMESLLFEIWENEELTISWKAMKHAQRGAELAKSLGILDSRNFE